MKNQNLLYCFTVRLPFLTKRLVFNHPEGRTEGSSETEKPLAEKKDKVPSGGPDDMVARVKGSGEKAARSGQDNIDTLKMSPDQKLAHIFDNLRQFLGNAEGLSNEKIMTAFENAIATDLTSDDAKKLTKSSYVLDIGGVRCTYQPRVAKSKFVYDFLTESRKKEQGESADLVKEEKTMVALSKLRQGANDIYNKYKESSDDQILAALDGLNRQFSMEDLALLSSIGSAQLFKIEVQSGSTIKTFSCKTYEIGYQTYGIRWSLDRRYGFIR